QETAGHDVRVVWMTVMDDEDRPLCQVRDGWIYFSQPQTFHGLQVPEGTVIDPDDQVWLPGSDTPQGSFAALAGQQVAGQPPGAGAEAAMQAAEPGQQPQ